MLLNSPSQCNISQMIALYGLMSPITPDELHHGISKFYGFGDAYGPNASDEKG
jgi:hypothetical protein